MKNINYKNLSEIIVKSQAELDAIPDDFKGRIYIEFGTKIEDIVLPENSNGKVRTSKVKVIREVPLEECGAYGKILLKRRLK